MFLPQKIVLVGPMGAGKSTIGRLLSKQLNMPFIDSDSVIEERSGADIPWIFDVEGEAGFRQREVAVLKDLMTRPYFVLATGGGAVLLEENRALMKSADVVIYLTAAPEFLLARVEKDKKRPLLNVEDPAEKVRRLFSERDPLYREVATRIVMTDTDSPKSVAKDIAHSLQS